LCHENSENYSQTDSFEVKIKSSDKDSKFLSLSTTKTDFPLSNTIHSQDSNIMAKKISPIVFDKDEC